MSIYTFKEEDAERFAKFTNIKYKRRGNQFELMFCPYCRQTIDKYTFGINLSTGQFECKRSSCRAKGNMITLSRDFDFSLGRDTDAYYRTVDYSKKQYKTFRDAHKIIESKTPAIEYLLNRGISEGVSKKYEITSRDDNDDILCFPFKDESGTLTFIKYRNTKYKKGDKGSKEYCESNCKPILFGMNHCSVSADEGCLIITEGQIDSLSVVMAGYTNAVSVPTGCNGFTWVPHCYDFVNRFSKIVVMGDCENGKITLSEEIRKRWGNKVYVCQVNDYRDCKDANEILQKYGPDAIRTAIHQAKPLFSTHIKPLAKVKQINIMDMTTISTGIKCIDEILDGGFRLGQLAVLTGKRGEGKSTIASMWGVHAINQGFNSFFYSGELPDFYFKNWMDCQVTGKNDHTKSEDDMLQIWYGEKAFIYNENAIGDDECESLLESVETAIIQRNCQFIMLDNLMTALDVDLDTDIYRSQSKFVGDLAKIAKKYNVFILLIAHPRKTNEKNLTNDSISGSSNITDKADIVLTYSKPDEGEKDFDENHRRLQITKNRLTGKLAEGSKALHLVYDSTGSRRIAENFIDFKAMDFGWMQDSDGFFEASDEDLETIPF